MDHDNQIRDRAYRLWEEEGRPEGRAEQHWFAAKEIIAVEDSQDDTLLPIDAGVDEVEPIEALENAGEFPTLTDQGEQPIPHRPRSSSAPINTVSDNDIDAAPRARRVRQVRSA